MKILYYQMNFLEIKNWKIVANKARIMNVILYFFSLSTRILIIIAPSIPNTLAIPAI